MGDRPLVAVLAERWPVGGPPWTQDDEASYLSRTTAAAVALGADVHVVTPGRAHLRAGAQAPGPVPDGAFELHALGNALSPGEFVRRRLMAEALVAARRPGGSGDDGLWQRAAAWLEAAGLWSGARAVLAELEPHAVMVCGHRHVGLLDVLPSSVPVIAVPLCGDPAGLGHPAFDDVLGRADVVLSATSAERRALVAAGGTSPAVVHDVGSVVPVNLSVLEEPPTELAGQRYILVTGLGHPADARASDMARLVTLRFPNHPVVLSGSGGLMIWRRGERSTFDPISRHIDLWRLMAWACCTVDLRPGPLLSRRAVESLLLATPVVVPAGSRAHQVVCEAGGGVCYRDGAELIGCVEVLLDSDTGPRLARQGRRYVASRYGGRDDFAARVDAAVAPLLGE